MHIVLLHGPANAVLLLFLFFLVSEMLVSLFPGQHSRSGMRIWCRSCIHLYCKVLDPVVSFKFRICVSYKSS